VDEQFETGAAVRREVLGPAYADRPPTEFGGVFREYVVRSAWGSVWSRPGLDRRTRSAITLAVLTALRAEGEIGMHVEGARRNGLTDAEIAEILLHTAVYAGAPAANAAFKIADEVLGRPPAEEERRGG
jgi:4-carboxymuconolactone decarboxylase